MVSAGRREDLVIECEQQRKSCMGVLSQSLLCRCGLVGVAEHGFMLCVEALNTMT